MCLSIINFNLGQFTTPHYCNKIIFFRKLCVYITVIAYLTKPSSQAVNVMPLSFYC